METNFYDACQYNLVLAVAFTVDEAMVFTVVAVSYFQP